MLCQILMKQVIACVCYHSKTCCLPMCIPIYLILSEEDEPLLLTYSSPDGEAVVGATGVPGNV